MTEGVRGTTAPLRASGAGGSIYDLGYQGYEGPREGRRSAIRALFWHSVRSCYGIGRGGRAKIAPFVLAILAILPAIIGVGIAALSRQLGAGDMLEEASPIRYETFNGAISVFVALFCAAQAPELLGRDQRYSVLPVYFSRALARIDYAVAKLLGLFASLLLLVVTPYLILFLGRVFVAEDPVTGLSNELPNLIPLIAQSLIVAGLLGSLSMAIAAFTPRRAFATAGIIALMLIPPIVAGIVVEVTDSPLATIFVLLSPPDVLEGTNAWLFDVRADSPTLRSVDLDGIVYLGAAVVGTVVAVLITIRRYLRIAV